MQIHKYLTDNNIELDFGLTHCLGDGADGACYQIDERRVLKLSVLFDWYNDLHKVYTSTRQTLSYLIEYGDPAYCKVHDFKHLGTFHRTIYNGKKQMYCLYYYVLDKLEKISEEENKVFHTILSHEDNNISKKYNERKLKNILQGLSWGLDFDIVKIKMFYDTLQQSKINHNDVHPRNIMKNKDGDFFMIDFDRCTLKKENNNG